MRASNTQTHRDIQKGKGELKLEQGALSFVLLQRMSVEKQKILTKKYIYIHTYIILKDT